jgi:hypothetical protein
MLALTACKLCCAKMLRWDAIVDFQIVLAVVYRCTIAICELHCGGTSAAQGYAHHTSSTTQL